MAAILFRPQWGQEEASCQEIADWETVIIRQTTRASQIQVLIMSLATRASHSEWLSNPGS